MDPEMTEEIGTVDVADDTYGHSGEYIPTGPVKIKSDVWTLLMVLSFVFLIAGMVVIGQPMHNYYNVNFGFLESPKSGATEVDDSGNLDDDVAEEGEDVGVDDDVADDDDGGDEPVEDDPPADE